MDPATRVVRQNISQTFSQPLLVLTLPIATLNWSSRSYAASALLSRGASRLTSRGRPSLGLQSVTPYSTVVLYSTASIARLTPLLRRSSTLSIGTITAISLMLKNLTLKRKTCMLNNNPLRQLHDTVTIPARVPRTRSLRSFVLLFHFTLFTAKILNILAIYSTYGSIQKSQSDLEDLDPRTKYSRARDPLKIYPISAITARSNNGLGNKGARYLRGLVLSLKYYRTLSRYLLGKTSTTSYASSIAKKPITIETISANRLYKARAQLQGLNI